ncbi:MAG: Fic family protein [Sulfurimonadaceae bacterium]
MDFTPIAPTNNRGVIPPDLLRKAEDLISSSAVLTGNHPKETIDAVKECLRTTNSYYSNKIESEGTRPVDIERAMKKEFDSDDKKRALQMLSLAHIETQKQIEQAAQNEMFNPYATDFICDVHKTLYSQEGMESFLQLKHQGLQERLVPGQLRTRDVAIGDHVAPSADELSSLMGKYELLYSRSLAETRVSQLVHALASHHRLAYLHPFLDGNGRTSRLVLDGALLSIKVDGYGLWNISRGLARDENAYKTALANADLKRQGNYDGTGSLSLDALERFVSFMLECAQDQVNYMGKYLKMNSLVSRLEAYVIRSQQGDFTIDPLPKNTQRIFKELLLKGEIKQRNEIDTILGISRRGASAITKELLQRGYLQSDGPKKPLRLKIETHLAVHLFPELE